VVHLVDGLRIALLGCEFGEFGEVGEGLVQRLQDADDQRQTGALAAQRLGAFRIVPDIGLRELRFDFFETRLLAGIVKGTP